jgi:hypothetical protein
MSLPPDIIAGSLSEAQRAALAAFCTRRNSPYGYYASDLGVSGAACSALERKGLLMGSELFGSRTRSYRWTRLGETVGEIVLAQVGRNAKRQDPNEDSGLGPKDEHAVGCEDSRCAQTPKEPHP